MSDPLRRSHYRSIMEQKYLQNSESNYTSIVHLRNSCPKMFSEESVLGVPYFKRDFNTVDFL